MTEDRSCKECRFAEWQRGKGGRILPKKFGKCTYALPDVPPLPLSVVVNWPPHKSVIWRDNAKPCPTFEPKASQP